jgi:inorganic pyrophosphatase
MKAIIEIPKGDDRRRHIKPDKSGFIDLGPIKDVIPVNGGIMPVHYGYIPGTLNEKEGDEIDVLVLSDKSLEVGQEVEVEPIALIKRKDEDDKVVAIDESKKIFQKWDDIPESERKLIEDFFSYQHEFLSIEDGQSARQYVENGHKQFLQTQK